MGEITVKLSNAKDRALKAGIKKLFIMYKGSSTKLILNFSSEITKYRRQWDNLFKILKEKECQ